MSTQSHALFFYDERRTIVCVGLQLTPSLRDELIMLDPVVEVDALSYAVPPHGELNAIQIQAFEPVDPLVELRIRTLLGVAAEGTT